MEGGNWHVWKATAAVYNSQDPVSFLFALSTLLPIVVLIFLAGMASATLSPRQAPALVLLLGLVYNALLNAVLKALVRSPRPPSPVGRETHQGASSAHGMPSDHSQFMFFFVSWLMRKADVSGIAMTLTMRGFLILAAVVVAYGRVYNGFHNFPQVLVGALVGIVNAYLCTTPLGERVLQQLAVMVVPIRDFCTMWTLYII
ncbi:PAP2 family protein [Trypanosoma grayi]|uniref:PAP2 family protein n=1 Tax=Trypanosoma grayi TaxID=71804 RepID=UPI0004F43656|nr:PAP2 family protein [Trypanosoma grayi]KEG07753.1 PAP2 family protein [Trypanosoma grayi]